jgi:CubicO group peptidase (beta-lactamase class C family)
MLGAGRRPLVIRRLSNEIDRAVLEVPARRHIQSIVVVRGGEVLLERYFRDRRREDLSNVHSVTKSVLATLVGLAIGDGLLSLDTSLGDVFGTRPFHDGDARKREITVEHLLTMTSGLDAASPHDIDDIADRGESWLAGPLAAPLRAAPGASFVYNNGAAHVLGCLLAEVAGSPLPQFAEARLFGPLGVEAYRWPSDPDGNALGYGHLELRPRDLARLGELYLASGLHRGVQLLSRSFVDAATRSHSSGGPPEGVSYGYLWWVTEECGHPSFFAGGYGGQYLTVVPALELVAVTTGDVDVFIESSRNLRRLVAEVVAPNLAGVTTDPKDA